MAPAWMPKTSTAPGCSAARPRIIAAATSAFASGLAPTPPWTGRGVRGKGLSGSCGGAGLGATLTC
eukprot:2394504-Pyramimonas_sp.AAC.1